MAGWPPCADRSSKQVIEVHMYVAKPHLQEKLVFLFTGIVVSYLEIG